MKEISELQAHQRGEIELLYRRLGKAPPSGLSLTSTMPPAGRRRKHKLRASKLLSPLVQQIRSVTKTSDSSKPGDDPLLLSFIFCMHLCLSQGFPKISITFIHLCLTHGGLQNYSNYINELW